MRRNASRTRTNRAAPTPPARRPSRSPLERWLIPAILALSISLTGCLEAAGEDVAPAAAAQTPDPGSVLAEHPVSVDLVIPFYVYYSTVASQHCASEVVRLNGPITNVDVTATWDAVVPETMELRVYKGTQGREVVQGHEEEDGQPIAEAQGPSPLTLDADGAGESTVRLRICQWDNLAVAQDVVVHLEGSISYLAPTGDAP